MTNGGTAGKYFEVVNYLILDVNSLRELGQLEQQKHQSEDEVAA